MASFNRRTYVGQSIQYTAENADATEIYMLEADAEDPTPPTLDELQAKKKEILGFTEFEPGKLSRTLPMAHPEDPNLVAYNLAVTPVQDEPSFVQGDSDPDEILEATPFPKTVLWGSYAFTIKFGPRPYAMVSDRNITKVDDSYYDEAGVQQSYSYYPEWYRYTDITFRPREDIVKAKTGQMLFRTSSGDPGGTPYPQLATMPLPNEEMIVTWYGIPYRYVKSANSYLKKYRYKLNQSSWEGYAPGSILYKGYSVLKRYTPPFAELDPNWGGVGVFSSEKLCDVEIHCLVTDRTATLPPASVSNSNWIVGGFNLLPYFVDRKFYYASSDEALAASQFPGFKSFPFPLLFQDPDA